MYFAYVVGVKIGVRSQGIARPRKFATLSGSPVPVVNRVPSALYPDRTVLRHRAGRVAIGRENGIEDIRVGRVVTEKRHPFLGKA